MGFTLDWLLPALFVLWIGTGLPAWPAAFESLGHAVPDAVSPWPWEEGSEAINTAKAENPMAGVTVYGYMRNDAETPVVLTDLAWDGQAISGLMESLDAVWWRMSPRELQPGQVGEIVLRLRTIVKDSGRLVAMFSDGSSCAFDISAREPDFRLQNIGYGPDRSSVFLYVERSRDDAALPDRVLLDGKQVSARWLSEGYVGRLRVGVVTLDSALEEGSWHVWTLSGGGVSVSSGLRVFAKPACSGTYGHGDIERIQSSGLDAYVSFGSLSREWLDEAASAGLEGAMHISGGQVPEPVRGHSAVYGYVLMDEPDVHDYNAKDRPMHQRIGANAQRLADEAQVCGRTDPVNPAIINLDLTFTPANYYIYGPIADFVTGDCYPVTIGKPLTFLRDCVTTLKRAAAPKPIGFIYQGSWEHFARKDIDRYVGAGEIRQNGYREYADPERVRGFNRPLLPEEVKMQMVYCLGAGARGLFSFIDATEASGGLVILGSCDLPEVWAAIGEVSRNLGHVMEDINIGHPIAWATSDNDTLWVRTLVCGEDAALIAVVNESGASDEDGLGIEHACDVVFTFADLPWLKAGRVVQVWGAGPREMPAARTDEGIQWRVPSVYGATIFRVSRGEQNP